MGVIVEVASPLGTTIRSRQAAAPQHLTGAFTADDVNNHDFKGDGRGKGRFTVAVDNPANKSLTFDIYGMHAIGDTVGSVGTYPIATAIAVALASKGYETFNDPFPFYLIRVTHTDTPTDNPFKTVTVNIDFSAF